MRTHETLQGLRQQNEEVLLEKAKRLLTVLRLRGVSSGPVFSYPVSTEGKGPISFRNPIGEGLEALLLEPNQNGDRIVGGLVSLNDVARKIIEEAPQLGYRVQEVTHGDTHIVGLAPKRMSAKEKRNLPPEYAPVLAAAKPPSSL